MVGDDPGFIKALIRAVTVAPYDEPVLIQGENGTGKEIIAKLIHKMSSRSGGKLVTVSCSAIPEDLELVTSESRSAIPDPRPGFSIEDYLSEVRHKLFTRALEILFQDGTFRSDSDFREWLKRH